jgi:hypothetical protein
MPRLRRFWCIPVAVALLASLGACDSQAPGKTADPGFAGHWTSTQWGEHYILVENSVIKIIYTHDDGRVVGTLDGTTFTGWWTEVPSRQPTKDAGDVTFTLTGSGTQRTIDGTWRYGAEGNLRENWDLTWVDDKIPPEVAAKFNDASAFLPHP